MLLALFHNEFEKELACFLPAPKPGRRGRDLGEASQSLGCCWNPLAPKPKPHLEASASGSKIPGCSNLFGVGLWIGYGPAARNQTHELSRFLAFGLRF